MRLKDFDKYERITIQCHDNPDADALGSGYGLYCYFKDRNKDVKFIYSGRNIIQKSNLKLMVEKLGISIEYVPVDEALNFDCGDILITVDCQYGAGNVTAIPAKDVAIIDHHQIEIENIEKMHVLSDYGSCSTVVWKLITQEGYKVSDDNYLATALYYGLLTDTNNFAEINNPIDRDMHDELPANNSLITQFCNSNISLKELEIAGIAMIRYSFNENHNYAMIKSQPCDPNILGVISDFLLQVDKVYSCVVFNDVTGGYKLSVRSCVREVNASELAAFLTEGIGSGGGHYQKAGGFISGKLYEEKYGTLNVEAYISNRMNEYFETFELIYADKYEAKTDELIKYKKKNYPVGYVMATDLLPVGTPILVRTLEGDMDLVIEEDLVIIIGIQGEVYPNKLEKFKRSYKMLDIPYDYDLMAYNNKYIPVVKNRLDGKNLQLTEYAKVCETTGNVQVYAEPLDRPTKVFTSWDKNRYMVGKENDMLAVRTDDLHDVYVVDREIFEKTYQKVEE